MTLETVLGPPIWPRWLRLLHCIIKDYVTARGLLEEKPTMCNIRVACQTSQSLNPRNCNISFCNLQSCTININTAPVPPNNSCHLTDKEFEDVKSFS